MNEIYENAEVEKRQYQRDRDRQVRNKCWRGTALDRSKNQNGIHKGRYEGSKAGLCAEIANEVAEHPRTELLRRQLQHENAVAIENTNPATVMTAAAIAISTCRAASGPPELTKSGNVNAPPLAARSIE